MLGFAGPKRSGSSGGRGGFVRPRRVAPVPRRATRVSAAPSSVARATHITFYDPSRVIKREHLRVVKDLRASKENAEERGEVQTNDNGITGPGSIENSTGINAEYKMTRLQARLHFADWLKTEHPAIFQRAIAVAENATNQNAGLGQVGPPAPTATIAVPTQSFWEKFSTAALGVGTTLLSLENQKKVLKINLERARQGLPPIDAATSAPVITTQVDLSPELTDRLLSTAGEGFNKILLLGAAAVAAFFIFK